LKELKGACIIGQSGGPTSVINASALGVIQTALKHDCITQVLAAEHGIRGVLDDRLFDFGQEDPAEVELLRNTPSSAIGSIRYKLKPSEEDETDYIRILEVFKKHNVRYFFYNGGNDSMDTCNKISKYMQKVGYECRVMGIPKTIDNDLVVTDHCPGYPSAAKYIGTSVAEIVRDTKVYDKGPIVLLEIMGRHAGWLAAAASLARVSGEGPALIYLPEVPFDMDKFLKDVTDLWNRQKYVVAAFSEGIRDKDGKFISEYGSDLAQHTDAFGHSQLGGLASTLSQFCNNYNGIKTRPIEYSLLQRCAAHCASQTDIDEAYLAGKTAVEAAVSGTTDRMVSLKCTRDGGYKCEMELIGLTEVANAEKTIPRDWINEDGNNVGDKYIEYALPLIQGTPDIPTENGMPRYPHLKYVLAK